MNLKEKDDNYINERKGLIIRHKIINQQQMYHSMPTCVRSHKADKQGPKGALAHNVSYKRNDLSMTSAKIYNIKFSNIGT